MVELQAAQQERQQLRGQVAGLHGQLDEAREALEQEASGAKELAGAGAGLLGKLADAQQQIRESDARMQWVAGLLAGWRRRSGCLGRCCWCAVLPPLQARRWGARASLPACRLTALPDGPLPPAPCPLAGS